MTVADSLGALTGLIVTQAGDVEGSAGSASGGTSSGGGGGGGGGISDKEQYYRIYKAVCQILGIKLNPKIAAMAFKTRQSGTGFLSLVKKLDPQYLKTDDFKNRAASFVKKWNEYLPMQKVDFNDMKKFVRGDWSSDRIDLYLQSTKAFKKTYPYFRVGVDDPRTYLAHERAITNSLSSSGLGQLTDRRKELFHKLDMSSDEVNQRIEELVTGHDAVDQMYGTNQPTGTNKVNDYIFNTPGNMVRRQVLQEALKAQGGLNQSKVAMAGLRRQEQTGKIIQTGI